MKDNSKDELILKLKKEIKEKNLKISKLENEVIRLKNIIYSENINQS